MTEQTPTNSAMVPCCFCGMPCASNEYHPYAACLMFKACHNSETVRANLEAVRGSTVVAGEAVAVVGIDAGGFHLSYGGKYIGPQSAKKTVMLLKDLPLGTQLFTTPQPTKAQAKQITAQQSYDAGFSNGWDRGVAYLQTQTKAGSVPMTDSELVRRSRAGAIQTDDSGKVVLRPTHYRGQMEARFRHGWREAERHHGITKEGGQHDDR